MIWACAKDAAASICMPEKMYALTITAAISALFMCSLLLTALAARALYALWRWVKGSDGAFMAQIDKRSNWQHLQTSSTSAAGRRIGRRSLPPTRRAPPARR